MSIAIDLPLELIDGIDHSRAARGGHIVEHTRHFLRRVFPMIPAVGVRVRAGSVTATSLGKLVPIARELGHVTIRAMVESDSDPKAVDDLLARPGVRRLSQAEIFADADPLAPEWHVLYFSGPLTEAERELFASIVFSRFAVGAAPSFRDGARNILEVNSLDDGQGLEFRAITPAGDERWLMSFVASLNAYHQKVRPIVSYQGKAFAPPTPPEAHR